MEQNIINVIERHKRDIEINNSHLTIKLKCNPSSKNGKELFEVLNFLMQENYTLIFGSQEYECVKWQTFYPCGNFFERLISKYFENDIEMYMLPLSKTNTVDIKKANQVNIFTESINSIKAKKFIYKEELDDNINADLLFAINNIENSLNHYIVPNYSDMTVVKKFAKSSSNIASFAADVITILAVFIK